MTNHSPPVAIIMGSQSDWPVMRAAAAVLDELGVAYDARHCPHTGRPTDFTPSQNPHATLVSRLSLQGRAAQHIYLA